MMVAWGTVAAGALAPFQAISSQGTPQDGRLQQKLHVCYLFPSISGPFLVTHSSGAARCTSLRDVRLTAMPAYVTQQIRSSQPPGARRCGEVGVLQPRREGAGVGQPRQDGAAVGRGEGGVRQDAEEEGHQQHAAPGQGSEEDLRA